MSFFVPKYTFRQIINCSYFFRIYLKPPFFRQKTVFLLLYVG